MNTERFPVGSYAIAADIEAAIEAEQVTPPLHARTYGAHAMRCTYLQGDDVQWAIEAHASGYAFPLTGREAMCTVLLYGNEDSPYQVWASPRVALRITDELERIA